MASHMGVQTFATERNSQVEYFVHFILDKFCSQLVTNGLISDVNVTSQQQFSSEIASDIWDHLVTCKQANGKELQLWCQTTCYKGNESGKPEPNKTYEVRETLVEGITVRGIADAKKDCDFRTIHFTVGDKNYTYQWFLSLKTASYDKSVYIGQSGFDFFSALNAAFKNAFTESEKQAVLEACITKKDSIGILISQALKELQIWYIDEKMPKSRLADLQWGLVKSELATKSAHWPDFAALHGLDIKGRANRLLFETDGDDPDPLIAKAAAKVLAKKPFLSAALRATSDWPAFEKEIEKIYIASKNLGDFTYRLWNAASPLHLLARRILLRIHTTDAVAYVQDLNVKGVTEHNLYGGTHTDDQIKAICSKICSNLNSAGIKKSQDLYKNFLARGKAIINQARWFEAKNGTSIQPSFEYVELALRAKGFEVMTPSAAKFSAIGYHAEISSENVMPYTNLKVILKNGKILGLIKAKFFRKQEFPRRCKEEAFVGLTLKYSYKNGAFKQRLNVPLFMFVDMAADWTPPTYAIKRLMCFGWDVVFSTEELFALLGSSAQTSDYTDARLSS